MPTTWPQIRPRKVELVLLSAQSTAHRQCRGQQSGRGHAENSAHARSCAQKTCGERNRELTDSISRQAHCHRRCTHKHYHVNNKYKIELIYYPAPRRESCTAGNGDTAVAAIGIVPNEHGRGLSHEDQGGRCQVP